MIVAVFEGTDMTEEQYQQVMAELAAAGYAEPDGRIDHVAAWNGATFCVVDTWDSPESLNEFAYTLFPILDRNGVNTGPPHIYETRNTIRAV